MSTICLAQSDPTLKNPGYAPVRVRCLAYFTTLYTSPVSLVLEPIPLIFGHI